MNDKYKVNRTSQQVAAQRIMPIQSFEWREFVSARNQDQRLTLIRDPEERVEFRNIRYIRLCHKVLFTM